jgi:hypothetical protein
MTHVDELNRIAIVVLELELMGYAFVLDGETIDYCHNGAKPDPSEVFLRLELIRSNKADALEYLRMREQPVNLAERLFEASDRAAKAARQAEAAGDIFLAQYEWRRFARLYAAYAEETGIEPSAIGWDEWVKSIKDGCPK